MRDAFGVERGEIAKFALPGSVLRASTKAIGAGEKMISRGSSAFAPKTGMGAVQSKVRIGAGKSLVKAGMNPGKTLGIAGGTVGAAGVAGGGYMAGKNRY